MAGDWKPTVATLFLLLVLGGSLFPLMLSVFTGLGKQLGALLNMSESLHPRLPGNITSLSEYQGYEKQKSLLEELGNYLVAVLSNPMAVAVLIAVGILVAVYETHIKGKIPSI